MVVCHCLHINDRVIAEYAADPSITADDIVRACGAGGRCGGCRGTIEAMLDDARGSGAATPVAMPTFGRLVSAA